MIHPSRGYVGLAILEPKVEANLGGIIRNAHAFGATFIALIGARYSRQATDTSKGSRHLPVFSFPTLDAFLASTPHGSTLVRVERNGSNILQRYKHPERVVYLFGGEDRTIPLTVGDESVWIDTSFALNLATTTGIILYDRQAKT